MSLHSKSDRWKSVRQLVNSIVPFVLLWGLAYVSLPISIWITLALAILAAGFMIRIFIIFHDCCHQSFFAGRKANAIIGTITGILTFFLTTNGKTSIPFIMRPAEIYAAEAQGTFGR